MMYEGKSKHSFLTRTEQQGVVLDKSHLPNCNIDLLPEAGDASGSAGVKQHLLPPKPAGPNPGCSAAAPSARQSWEPRGTWKSCSRGPWSLVFPCREGKRSPKRSHLVYLSSAVSSSACVTCWWMAEFDFHVCPKQENDLLILCQDTGVWLGTPVCLGEKRKALDEHFFF